MYMKRKLLIHKFKKYKNLNFIKMDLGLFKIGGGGGGEGGGWGGGGAGGGYLDIGLFKVGG